MDLAMDAIEKRISALELQVLPKDKDVDILNSQTIIDCLIATQGMITTALSCRESVAAMLQRLHTINEYLNPSHENEQTSEYRQYVLSLYPAIKEMVIEMKILKTSQSVLDFDHSDGIDNLCERVQKLNVLSVDTYKESKSVTEALAEALEQLHSVLNTYKILFAQFEYNMSLLEASLQSQKQIDD